MPPETDEEKQLEAKRRRGQLLRQQLNARFELDERGPIGRVSDLANQAIGAVSTAITGEGRFGQDLPELAPGLASRAFEEAARRPVESLSFPIEVTETERLLRAAQIPPTTLGKATAIRSIRPDAKMDFDDFGNLTVDIDGQKSFLNRPGASAQDVREVGVDTLFEAPLILAGGALGKALLGGFGRVAGVGTGAAGGNVLRQAAGRLAGAKSKVDPGNAAVTGGLAAGFEFLLPAFGRFINRAMRNRRLMQTDKGGQFTLTAEGRIAFQRAGIDPDSVTDQFLRQFRDLNVDDLGAAARVAEAESLPQKVPLSRGDATRQATAQSLEDAARKGTFGPEAQAEARAFRDVQSEALRANQDILQRRLGGEAISEAGEGLATARAGLSARKSLLKAQVKDAYDTARSGGAAVVADSTRTMTRTLRKGLTDEGFDPRNHPKAFGLADDLAAFTRRAPGRVKTVKLNALEAWRKRVVRLQQAGGPEGAAAGTLKRGYDDYLDALAEQALIVGDNSVVDAFKKSRRLNTELNEMFTDDGIIARILETERTIGGGSQFKMQPSEAVNLLFNRSRLVGKQGSANALERMKTILGADSAEWAALRQEGFLRLFSNQPVGPETRFSGAKFRTSLDAALKQSPEMMRILYSPEELNMLQRLKRVALSATTASPDAAINFSNTTNLASILLRQFGFVGRRAEDLLLNFKLIGPNAPGNLRSVQESLSSPLLSPMRTVPPGVSGLAAIPLQERR